MLLCIVKCFTNHHIHIVGFFCNRVVPITAYNLFLCFVIMLYQLLFTFFLLCSDCYNYNTQQQQQQQQQQ